MIPAMHPYRVTAGRAAARPSGPRRRAGPTAWVCAALANSRGASTMASRRGQISAQSPAVMNRLENVASDGVLRPIVQGPK